MSISATFSARLSGISNDGQAFQPAIRTIDLQKKLRFKSGTAAGQIDRWYIHRYTIAASGTLSLDLAGVLVDEFGATVTAAKIRGLWIDTDEDNTNDLQLTRPASNGFILFKAAGDGIDIGPGDHFDWFSNTGKAVAAGTGDLLLFTNAAGSAVTFDIVVLGTSA